MDNFNLPSPIIFGPNRPNIRVRLEDGKQYVYSISNCNLYIDETYLTEDGTYAIGSLPWQRRGPPFFAWREKLELPECTAWYYDKNFNPMDCPMLIESSDQYEDDSVEPALKLARVKLHSKPQLYQCQMLSALLSCASTPAEKRFAEMYYRWAIAGIEFRYTCEGELVFESDLSQKYADFVENWHGQQLHFDPRDRHAGTMSRGILRSIGAPVLIPQVWLNYTYNPKRSPDEDRKLLGNMPRRVDFLYIRNWQLHVVEIDGPSHYAKYDEHTRKYEVDEEQYTRNLRAERALRRQGIQIHRISNREILDATELELINLISDALGIEF